MFRRLGAIAGQSTDAPPGAPTITSVTPGDGTLSIAFTAPVSDGGRPITNYQYSLDNGANWTTRSPAATSSPILVSELNNGTTYQVIIRAINIEGLGQNSNMLSGTPRTTPSAPQSVLVTNSGGGINPPVVNVSFSAPASNGGNEITNYEYSTNGGSSWTALSPASTSSPISIAGLLNSSTYSVGIRAVNGAGSGAASAFTPIRPLPSFEATPTATTPEVSSYSAQSTQTATFRTVNWTANLSNDFAAGTWNVTLHRASPSSILITSSNYTATNSTNGSFTLDYNTYQTHWGQEVHAIFTITDVDGQTSSYQTPNFTLPALQTTTVTTWDDRSRTYNAPSYISPLYNATENGYQKPSEAVFQSSASRAFDNDSDTSWSIGSVVTTKYCEVWARFFVSEGIIANIVYAGNTGNNFNSMVTLGQEQSGLIINTAVLNMRDFRSRHTFRTDNWLFMYDNVADAYRNGSGTQRGTFPSGTNLSSHNSEPFISRRLSDSTDIPSVNGVTWNETWSMSSLDDWTRGTVFGMPYFDVNVSLVQRGSTGGNLCAITDVQVLWGATFQEMYSYNTTTYK